MLQRLPVTFLSLLSLCRPALTSEFRFWDQQQQYHNTPDDISLDGASIHGLNTFASLPYQNCFANYVPKGERYDIAILGAPHDTTVTGRPGARYGPSSIRSASQRKFWGYSVFTGRNPLDDWARLVDCGDVPLTWLDNRAAIGMLDRAHRAVGGHPAKTQGEGGNRGREEGGGGGGGRWPRIVALGGDHTTTLSALRGVRDRWGEVAVIHFDSHIDTWDPKVLGGGISDYAGLNHGTFLHVAHEEGLILNTSVHAGIRAPLNRRKADLRNDMRCGFEVITARDIDDADGARGIARKIRDRVGEGTRVYVSVDIDVLDPAFAPATGTPEAGGWSTRELLAILAGLEGLQVVGGDVVEVAPAYDTAGETTALAAAEVAAAIIDLMVVTPVGAEEEVEAGEL